MPSKEFKELQVFLFEQAIIFSEIVGKRTQFIQPVFIYKAHIQVRVHHKSGFIWNCFARPSASLLTLVFCFDVYADEQNVSGWEIWSGRGRRAAQVFSQINRSETYEHRW